MNNCHQKKKRVREEYRDEKAQTRSVNMLLAQNARAIQLSVVDDVTRSIRSCNTSGISKYVHCCYSLRVTRGMTTEIVEQIFACVSEISPDMSFSYLSSDEYCAGLFAIRFKWANEFHSFDLLFGQSGEN
jgi:hypothetical protein